MKKSFFVTIFVLMIALVFSGCLAATTTNIVETEYGVYDLYLNCMLKCRNEISENITLDNFGNADKTKAKAILLNLDMLSEEELAIIASVECYNMITTPKNITMDMDGGIINVRQQNGKYDCNLEYDDADAVNYTFDINKQNGEYIVGYKQNDNDCKANVVFDQSTSHIKINLESYNAEAKKVKIIKDFYLLQNNHMALRINFKVGTASNGKIYGIDFYREVFNFNAKMSILQAFGGEINKNNLSAEAFVATNSNDVCGYILKHKDGKETEVNSFGDLKNW